MSKETMRLASAHSCAQMVIERSSRLFPAINAIRSDLRVLAIAPNFPTCVDLQIYDTTLSNLEKLLSEIEIEARGRVEDLRAQIESQ